MKSLRKTRLVSQILFFVLILLSIFAVNRYALPYSWPADWYLRLNPLTGILTSLASGVFVTRVLYVSVFVLLLTILFGRVFCGFFCPLGSLVDFFDKYIFRKPPKDRRPPVSLRKLKYIFLIGICVLAVFGVWFPLFADPLSFFTRAAVLIFNPVIGIIKADGLTVAAPVLQAVGAEDILYSSFKVPLYYGVAGVIILLVTALIGGFWDRRFYCQYICPTGAFLGLMSRLTLFKRKVSAEGCDFCKGGNTCAKVCPTRAVDNKDITLTSSAECVVCGVCTDIKDACSGFAFGGASSGGRVTGADFGRRQVIAGCVGGICALPLTRGSAAAKHDGEGRIMRPPGAVPESMFTGRCIGCGACVKVCPTNALQLCSYGDGFHRLYTPKLVPRVGGCEEKCYICGHVCPTGAIRKLTYEEKRFVKIGTAVINKDKCLPWEQNKECLVCDEVCPYNAITTRVMDTPYGPFKSPVVNEDLCLGCGICEEHCPIFDEAAIVVFKFSENRRAHGAYLSESQKKEVLEERRKSDSELGSTLTGGGENPSSFGGGGSDMPEGFSFEEDAPPEPKSDIPEGFTFD